MSWQVKPRFSRYFAGGLEGLSHSKDELFENEYRGADNQAETQVYIGEALVRSTVDALTDTRKNCLLIISFSWKAFRKDNA